MGTTSAQCNDQRRGSKKAETAPGADNHLHMLVTCDYSIRMSKMIQIRNVPDPIHQELKVRATRASMTLSDYLLRELQLTLARPTPESLRARLATRKPVSVDQSSTELVRHERDGR